MMHQRRGWLMVPFLVEVPREDVRTRLKPGIKEALVGRLVIVARTVQVYCALLPAVLAVFLFYTSSGLFYARHTRRIDLVAALRTQLAVYFINKRRRNSARAFWRWHCVSKKKATRA